ncbi:MAG: potassium channel protein [Candidatus Marinimicrobia bacterium]|nr:potassium channel protein [Candidatus Neomarinimicrobiota bacterium]MCF7850812.1 potassium channel protein [Candidatus Neomarinimicrobiota bacterium]
MLNTRIERLMLGMLGIVLIGTAGFVILEGVNWFDALYMTTITLATVGFNEVWELSALGRIWTIVIMFSGIGIFFLIVGHIAQRTVDLQHYRRFRMASQVKRINEHFILCGYGRMGQAIAKELVAAGKKFVVIEKDTEKVGNLMVADMVYIEGDATDDEVLIKAGIERATTLIGVLKDDQDNLFLTLSARSMKKELFILTRATSLSSIPKMKQAGADMVMNPYETAGIKLARMAMSPGIVEYIELIMRRGNLDLALETYTIKHDSRAENRSIAELEVRKNYNIIITAVEQVGGISDFNPDPNYKFKAGDKLIALGNMENLLQFEEICEAVI